MSEIALYDLLRRIPEVSNDEAKAAVADVASAKEVATKSDIRELKTELKTELKYIRWFLGSMFALQLTIVGVLVALFQMLPS